eukprot:TRINITY_DN3443_c0_g1_i1.p1 TRINITY_DN3443_c0_g1~~TRINITY_DN3443_c0_g1_i1.p1  ORF type:complete len:993 (-),score=131.33 TRINITY_DN3443_c0_g1_i1:162-3140(-)
MYLPILTCLLTTFFITTHCMYEEQLGSFDWHKQYVGLVNNCEFNNKAIRAYVSTKQGALSSIYLKDGSITWRKIIQSDQVTDQQLSQGSILRISESSQRGLIAHVDDGCEQVRVWDAQNGDLIFNQQLSSRGCEAADVAWVGARYLTILGDGVLTLLKSRDGMQIWQTDQLFNKGDYAFARISASDEIITIYAAQSGSSTLKIIKVSGSDGEVTSSKKFQLETGFGDQSGLTQTSFIFVDKQEQKVCGIGIQDSSSQGCVQIQQGEKIQLKTKPELSQFVVEVYGQNKNSVEIIDVENGMLKSIKLKEFTSTISTALSLYKGPSEETTGYVAIVQQQKSVLSYDIVSTADGEIVQSEKSVDISKLGDTYDNMPHLSSVYFGTFSSKSAKVGVRLVCVFSDWSLAFVQQDVLVWSRQEALAGITEAKFFPLPPPTKELEKQYRASAPGLEAQLKAQFLAIKQSFTLAQPHEVEELETLRQELSDKRLPWRDTNGFRRLIITPTQSGKLFAIHNGNGMPQWSLNFDPERPPSHVEIWRNSHDPAQDILVMVLLPPAKQGQTKSTLVLLDAYDGSEVLKEDLPYSVEFIIRMKQRLVLDKLDQNIFLFIEQDKQSKKLCAHVHPSRESAAILVDQHISDTFFWTVDMEERSMQGYGFARSSSSVSTSHDAVPTWKMTFPNAILSVAGKVMVDQYDPIYSQVKVLGDRSLLFKYRNDNLVVVATGLEDGKITSVMDASEVVLSVYFIDSVTGRIVYRQDHPGARGPVKVVLSEHWGVYHYWSVLNEGWQMTVVELYEDVERQIDLVDLLLGQNVLSYNLSSSSFDRVPVKALSQTFFTTLPVKDLQVTQTRAGLSVKNVLMASYGDQIYAMDKRLLDPRRPKLAPGQKPTQEHMLEGLRPFQAYLPLASTSFATYNKRVSGFKGMVTAPAGLESTSLVFAYGMDLFYTRLMPSKGFDSLDEYFSYALLILAMVGLLVGTVVVRWIHKSNKLKQKWK